VQRRFEATAGLDPLFQPHDAAVSPRADVTTLEARRRAYSLLLDRGLIRIGLPLPAESEFDLSAVDDPYRFANVVELSLFRRPLPVTNLKFLTSAMWAGRESPGRPGCLSDLLTQAAGATTQHAPGALP